MRGRGEEMGRGRGGWVEREGSGSRDDSLRNFSNLSLFDTNPIRDSTQLIDLNLHCNFTLVGNLIISILLHGKKISKWLCTVILWVPVPFFCQLDFLLASVEIRIESCIGDDNSFMHPLPHPSPL